MNPRRELGIAADEFAVGTVTRLHDSKGNSYLVDAAAEVVRQRSNARFFLVGEGPLQPELEAQAARHGLGSRFVFAGFKRDVARTLSAFDLSVFPSLWEGTPITAFAALAARILWAMDRPDERARLSQEARQTGRQYDIEAFVRKMERLYVLLNEVSRASHRRGVQAADLAFLTAR